jgi:hypothetical protein
MYDCKNENHSICNHCVRENDLVIQAHYYDEDTDTYVYEDYDSDEHEGVEMFVVKECSLCQEDETKSKSMKDQIAEIVGKHCKRNKQKLCKELYDLLSLN